MSTFMTVFSGLTLAWLVTCLILALLLLCGCSRKVYVPTERVITRIDTCFYAQLRVDSVTLRDSVAVIQRGDTVYMTKYRDRFRYRERVDTVYSSAVDSVTVRVPYPVERELTAWEKAKMQTGGAAIALTAAAAVMALIALAVWLIKVKRRK